MMLHFLLSAIAISSHLANAALIQKRGEGLKCESLEACVRWYTTGNAGCSSDYDFSPLSIPGYPGGSYCQKTCSDAEKAQCAAGQCTFYKAQCNSYPGSEICAKALVFCNTPIQTTEDNCVLLRMGQPVIYDEEEGTCEIDANAGADEHYVRFVIGQTSVELNLFMSCAPVTAAGASSFADSITDKTSSCQTDETSDYEIVWKCQEGKEKFKEYEQAAREACAVAAAPEDATPVFKSATG